MRTLVTALVVSSIALLAYPNQAWAVGTPPSVSAPNGDGDLTVTFNPIDPNGQCGVITLERLGPGATIWSAVSSSNGFANVQGLGTGIHAFRTKKWCEVSFPGGGFFSFNFTFQYSDPAAVSVMRRPQISPGSLQDQYDTPYMIRTGDFDANGFEDILIERIGGDPNDGTLVTTILYNDGAQFSAILPSPSQLSGAQQFSENPNIQVAPSDENHDGYADLILQGIDAIRNGALTPSGYSIEELIIYASGQSGVKQPLGVKMIDDVVQQFLGDLTGWAIDEDYFQDRTILLNRIEYDLIVQCDFFPDTPIFQQWRSCWVVAVPVVTISENTDMFNDDAKDFADKLDQIKSQGINPGSTEWGELSDIYEGVFGVPAYGFTSNGQVGAVNYPDVFDADTLFYRMVSNTLYGLAARGLKDAITGPFNQPDPNLWEYHEYGHTTAICTPGQDTFFSIAGPFGPKITSADCTLANLFCWMKKAPAPRQDNLTTTVTDGQESVLWGNNPIQTHIFDGATTLVNETLRTHLLDDPFQTLDCGKFPTAAQIIGNPNAPNRCSFVLRRGFTDSNGVISIETDGRGYSPSSAVEAFNELSGEAIFRGVDAWVLSKMIQEGSCAPD
ncbi:MAG: hypothetical protein AAFR07_00375 [Pseudomonadota bacterium]